ncbi:MAG: hypothetical protein ACKORY_12435, partial [Actinomycetota bacterium]
MCTSSAATTNEATIIAPPAAPANTNCDGPRPHVSGTRFELLYRVYLAALIGGFVVLYLSSLVQDAPFT